MRQTCLIPGDTLWCVSWHLQRVSRARQQLHVWQPQAPCIAAVQLSSMGRRTQACAEVVSMTALQQQCSRR